MWHTSSMFAHNSFSSCVLALALALLMHLVHGELGFKNRPTPCNSLAETWLLTEMRKHRELKRDSRPLANTARGTMTATRRRFALDSGWRLGLAACYCLGLWLRVGQILFAKRICKKVSAVYSSSFSFPLTR